MPGLMIHWRECRRVSGKAPFPQRGGKGYRHEFSSNFGCTVPNRYKEVKFWIPAVLLDDDGGVEVTKHIFVASKAKWDEIPDGPEQFEGIPDPDANAPTLECGTWRG